MSWQSDLENYCKPWIEGGAGGSLLAANIMQAPAEIARLAELHAAEPTEATEIIAIAQRLLELVDLDDETDQADYERVMAWEVRG